MEKQKLKILVYTFVCMVGFGLGLVAVSLFMSVVDLTSKVSVPGSSGTYNASLGLFDADWDSLDASPAFLVISFLVLVVGLVLMAVDASYKQKLAKKIKGLNYIALAVSVVGLVLLIVASLVTLNSVEDSMMKIMIAAAKQEAEGALTDQQIATTIRMMCDFNLGSGTIMAIIGGVISVIGCIMLIIPAFDPIKLAAEPAAPAQPVADSPAAPVEQNASAQPVTKDELTNDSSIADPAANEAAATDDDIFA